MLYRNDEDYEKKRLSIIARLNNKGIKVQEGKKKPASGEYSGILGFDGKVLKIKFPK